jgi:hypothetical protein
MRMTVVALRRPLADGMAVEAAWMLKHPTGLDEQRAGALGRIRDRRKCLGRAEILSAWLGDSGRECH